jgi:hypothetical protein
MTSWPETEWRYWCVPTAALLLHAGVALGAAPEPRVSRIRSPGTDATTFSEADAESADGAHDFRGTFRVEPRRRTVVTRTVSIAPADLRRHVPHIVIDPRWFRSDDE